MQQPISIPCTCQEPPDVAAIWNNSNSNNDNNGRQDEQLLLLQRNLQHFGWSPIRIHVPFCVPPTQTEISRLFYSDEGKNSLRQHKNKDWIYRAAESGGSETLIEPKESLEVSYKTAIVSNHRVHDWCKALSFIAHKVANLLQLPPNTLLAQEENNGEDCIDLMRVFYYHKLRNDANNKEMQSQQFGSSPHTDWGSWTVVWQDDVGGLETYCRACSKWVPVKPAPALPSNSNSNTNTWQCIVHVSDMTSLVLGLPPSTISSNRNDATNTNAVQWPSPRHRVVCSTVSIRTSLVYFAYPSCQISLKEMQEKLQDWNLSNRGLRLPLEEYYLLRDQSSSSSSNDKGNNNNNNNTNDKTTNGDVSFSQSQLSQKMYETIASLSIEQAIATKWNQVQRTAT